MSFYQELIDSQLKALGDQLFLPLSTLNDFTKDTVTTQLSPLTRFFCRNLADKVLLQTRKIFIILVFIGKQDTLRVILQDGLKDEDLPLSLHNDGSGHTLISGNGKLFKSFSTWNEVRVRDFLDKQWLVLAPVFDRSGQRIELNTKCALPSLNSEYVAGENACMVYRGIVPPRHHAGFKEDRVEVTIKEFRIKASFDKEEENLLKIQNLEHKHLIKIIATCNREPSSYVIFPWADGGNLREFWQSRDSQRTPDLILWSLQQMFGLADGLKALHDENCRHDVGVSKFHKEVTRLRNLPTNTKATTPSYEAPEAHPDIKEPRSRVYDTWSMGCIYLEWIVWLLYGLDAVQRFRKVRTSDDPMIVAGSFYIHTHKGTPPVHPKVSEAVRALAEDPRCREGTALGDLVGFIAEDLLVDPDSRGSAANLSDQLEMIVHDALQRPSYLANRVDPPRNIPKFFTTP
ncbi:hypothetical protein QQX98_011360 [Neonectria punicea]|uniref:Protein kinase domain-containing protein n=1 Tax=Neonectria punicea TaxID=979145 RepID=A0ABR1GMB2_9HYPO